MIAVLDALEAARIPHAVGGAISLAYCTQEPRGTRDLDVNAFVPPERSAEVLDAMPDGVTITRGNRSAARRDGQVRLWWEDTPVDLFFDTHEFHLDVAKDVRHVPFEGRVIPVIGCVALVVFKALFGRPRDWADIEEVLDANRRAVRDALGRLRELVGPADDAVRRMSDLLERRRF